MADEEIEGVTLTADELLFALSQQPVTVDPMKEELFRQRIKERSEVEIKALMNRLNRIEGQVRGIKRMVVGNVYCPDILIQVSAVNAALNAFNREMLNSHIKNCVKQHVKEGDDGVLDELLKTLQKLMK